MRRHAANSSRDPHVVACHRRQLGRRRSTDDLEYRVGAGAADTRKDPSRQPERGIDVRRVHETSNEQQRRRVDTDGIQRRARNVPSERDDHELSRRGPGTVREQTAVALAEHNRGVGQREDSALLAQRRPRVEAVRQREPLAAQR